MTNRRVRNLVILAVVCGAALGGLWALRQSWIGHALLPPSPIPTVSDVPVFTTPPALSANFDPLYLRMRNGDDGSVLITAGRDWVELLDVPDLWPVYRYDPHLHHIMTVQPTEWKTAGHPTTKAGRGMPTGQFFCRDVDGILKFRTRPGVELSNFETVGQFALTPTFSPDGRIICVLTADSPERPESAPFMFFGSVGGGHYGQHYAEFFRIPEMTRVREAVRIPFTTVTGVGEPCWSPDGRFLVYPNAEGTRMVVIHVYEEGHTPDALRD